MILVSSCETFVELEIPDSEQRLVINALLEPSSPVFVHVTSSNSILEEDEFEIIHDAMVTITDEEGMVHSLKFVRPNEWAPNYGYYTTEEFDPVPGSTYTIETSKPGFETATSYTKIPKKPNIKSFSFKNLPFEQNPYIQYQYPKIEFNLVFDDPAGENYYEIELYYEGSGEVTDHEGNQYETSYEQFAYLHPKNPAYEQDYRNYPGIIINDRLFDQQEASVDLQTAIPANAQLKVKVYLREITKESFRYGMSHSLQRNNRGDPLSQPVQVFSNIENGFGIMGARNSTYMEDSIFIAK
jgi:hypothetical protein